MKRQASVLWIVLIQWAIAYEWLQSGWGKFASSGFMDGIGKTLAGFAAKTEFGFYGDFLRAFAVPNPTVFGNVVRFSELAAGLGISIGGLLVLRFNHLPKYITIVLVAALYGGAILNANLYMAAGWSSPSTAGINVIMCLVQAILGTYYLTTLFGGEGNKKKTAKA